MNPSLQTFDGVVVMQRRQTTYNHRVQALVAHHLLERLVDRDPIRCQLMARPFEVRRGWRAHTDQLRVGNQAEEVKCMLLAHAAYADDAEGQRGLKKRGGGLDGRHVCCELRTRGSGVSWCWWLQLSIAVDERWRDVV